MIEGKLGEEHEPRNVQVDVCKLAPGLVTIKLRGENGLIAEVAANEELGGERESSEERARARSGSEGSEESGSGGAGLIAELESAQDRACELEAELESRKHAEEHLTAEVSRLNDKVREEKEKYTTLWRLNCAQLAEYDEALACKDEEIHALTTKVDGLEARLERETRGRAVLATTGRVDKTLVEGAITQVSDHGHDHTPLPSASPRETQMLHAVRGVGAMPGSSLAASEPSVVTTATHCDQVARGCWLGGRCTPRERPAQGQGTASRSIRWRIT